MPFGDGWVLHHNVHNLKLFKSFRGPYQTWSGSLGQAEGLTHLGILLVPIWHYSAFVLLVPNNCSSQYMIPLPKLWCGHLHLDSPLTTFHLLVWPLPREQLQLRQVLHCTIPTCNNSKLAGFVWLVCVGGNFPVGNCLMGIEQQFLSGRNSFGGKASARDKQRERVWSWLLNGLINITSVLDVVFWIL